MCGGIAGSFSLMAGSKAGISAYTPAFTFNLGRLLSYMLLGGLAALILGITGDALHVPGWSRILRALTAVMILLIGMQFLFGMRLLEPLERMGSGVWKRVQPFAVRMSARPGLSGRLLLGLCWGMIPCGLVYSVLLTAASSNSLLAGSLVMLAFGLGTLPSMLGVAWVAPSLNTFMHDQWVRKLIGFSLVLLAAWTFFMVMGTGMHK